MTSRMTRRSLLLAAGAGAAGLASGSALTAAGSPDGEPNVAAVGFCTDMSIHHVQALAMCQRVLGRDTGAAVQAAASEVLQTQSIEVGMMRAWLADWGESTSAPDTVMGWMGMNGGEGMSPATMTGLASDDEMRALSLATGVVQGRLWLELMRAHHVGGVHMAEAAIGLANVEKVSRLARNQVQVQTYEIEQYDLLLETEYA